MNIEELQKRSASLTDKLQKQLKDQVGNGRQEDTRFWKPTRDKAGNGYAVIRFLPPPMDPNSPNGIEDSAYVRMYSFGFQGPSGTWYIEKSRRTIGEADPVNEYVRSLWATKEQAKIDQARKHSQRTRFISNVLVIEDPAKPECNGKVFLYEYGKKIFDLIADKLNPQFADEVKIDAFNFWTGANFKLKIREVDKFPNYDRSEFAEQSALFGGDKDKLEAVWKQCHSLKAFLEPSNFLSYEELEKKFHRVMGFAPRLGGDREREQDHESEPQREAPTQQASQPRSEPAPEPKSSEPAGDSADDELEFFKTVAGLK
jgi:hypothetical protein